MDGLFILVAVYILRNEIKQFLIDVIRESRNK